MEAEYSTLSVRMEVPVSSGSCASRSNIPLLQAAALREDKILLLLFWPLWLFPNFFSILSTFCLVWRD